MRKLAITCSDAGAGCLKQARIADKVLGVFLELVSGPSPFTDAPLDFFPGRAKLLPSHAEDWELDLCLEPMGCSFSSVENDVAACDRIEIWVDPTPNGQLVMAMLIDWLRTIDHAHPKIRLIELDKPLGNMWPETIINLKAPMRTTDDVIGKLSSDFWKAYRQPAPVEFYELLQTDLNPLPRLRTTIVRLLDELPHIKSGLAATQRQILSLIADGATTAMAVLSDKSLMVDVAAFDYWTHGRMLTELSNCRRPAICGVTEANFNLELHDDVERLSTFRKSKIGLTDYGYGLLASEEDFVQDNPIDRWWGGTHLVSNHVWRWDTTSQSLVAPN